MCAGGGVGGRCFDVQTPAPAVKGKPCFTYLRGLFLPSRLQPARPTVSAHGSAEELEERGRRGRAKGGGGLHPRTGTPPHTRPDRGSFPHRRQTGAETRPGPPFRDAQAPRGRTPGGKERGTVGTNRGVSGRCTGAPPSDGSSPARPPRAPLADPEST